MSTLSYIKTLFPFKTPFLFKTPLLFKATFLFKTTFLLKTFENSPPLKRSSRQVTTIQVILEYRKIIFKPT